VRLIAVRAQVSSVLPVLLVIPAVGTSLIVKYSVTTLSHPFELTPVQVILEKEKLLIGAT